MAQKDIFTRKRFSYSPTNYLIEREHYEQREFLPPVNYKNNSRYTILRTLYQEEDKKTIHENWNQKFVDYTENDQYYTVTLDEVNRLDIIANYFYNTPRYWWVIALANYIIDPFDIPVGTRLRIPPILALYNKGGVLNGN